MVPNFDQWADIAFWGPRIVNRLAGVAFGSRLFDDHDADSDYDLAVIVPKMPAHEETRRLKSALSEKTGLQIDLFFATPSGIQARKNLDPMIHSLLETGRLLWGELGVWWNPVPFAVDGVKDAIITVESLTDIGDFSDLTPGMAEYSWLLLNGALAAWAGQKPPARKSLPPPSEISRSLAGLRDNLRSRLQNEAINE